MGTALLRRVHSRLKATPGFKSLDGLFILLCFRVAVPFWLKLCKVLLWVRLLTVAALEKKPLLVVARYGAMGDIICTFPAVAELTRQNPGQPVVYVVRKSLKSLVERSGLAVKIVAVRHHLELPSKPARVFKQSTYLCYPGELWQPGYFPARLTDGFTRCLGLANAPDKPTLRTEQAKAEALRARYLSHAGQAEPKEPDIRDPAGVSQRPGSARRQPLVLLHAGPTWLVKEWPVESWERLAGKLKAELGCVVLQLVAAKSITVKEPVCRLIPGTEPVECANDLDKLIHLVAAVDLLVGVDSGPVHVAGAVGTRAVVLFGPTDPNLILSNPQLAEGVFRRVECSFCHHRVPRLHWQAGCPYGIRCMKELAVEPVFAAVTRALNRPLAVGADK